MLDRFLKRIRPAQGPSRTLPQHRVSRREKDLQQQRLLYILAGTAAVVVIVLLLVGAAYQYYFYPNHALASVNGEKITRSDYWKVRELTLRQNIARLGQQMQLVSADQQTQLNQQIQDIQTELDQGHDAPVKEETLSGMVDNLVVLQHLDDFGITISNDEVQQYIETQFSPAPEVTATPTSGIDPTSQAWATATGEVRVAEATQTASAMQTAAAASPTASPTTEGTAAATGTVTPEGTAPGAAATGTTPVEGTPAGTPEASATPTTPAPTATLEPAAAVSTTEGRLDFYQKNYLGPSGMNMSDYRRLVARPELARNKIVEQLVAKVPTRAEQVHAAHILVATKDAADQVYRRVTSGGEDFAAVAKGTSTDTGTAANGGDLGWFPRGVMVKPFEDAAFSLPVGEISQPVQSQFGWHIIKVLDKQQDRPITIEMLQTLRNKAYTDWMDTERQASKISSDVTLSSLSTPTPTTQFQAPPDAPPLPTPTPVPATPTVEGTPTTETTPGAATATP